MGTLSTTDGDAGDTHTYTLVTGGGDDDNGSFTINGNQLITNVVLDYETKNSLSIRIKTDDGNGGTYEEQFTITVAYCNSAPTANSQSVSTSEDYSVSISLSSSDPEGDTCSYVKVSNPSHGSLTSFNSNTDNVTYNPDSNYTGTDSFTFKVNDGEFDSSVATVNITVSPVNDPPRANSQSLTIDENQSVNITLTGSDLESSISFSIISNPAHGSILNFSSNSGTLTYSSDLYYAGADSFTFVSSDGARISNVATVSININRISTPTATDSPTPLPPTDTPLPPTATEVPPTAKPVTPTATLAPPTATPIPPTATPVPPTATLAPPTDTPVPPTATPVPPTATSIPPTATYTAIPTKYPEAGQSRSQC